MIAGAFSPPDLLAMRQNFALRKQSFLAAAAQAHSVSTARSHGLPPVVRLLLFFPALRLLPGHSPAHERSDLSPKETAPCHQRFRLESWPRCALELQAAFAQFPLWLQACR